MLIVTPNPAIDHTIRLTALRPGEVLRTGPGISVAGDKGGNVARAARLLGCAATVLAFAPEIGRRHLETLYATEGLDLVTVPVGGRVRTCTAMIESDGRVTLLNEPGARVTGDDWARLVVALQARLATGDERLVVCSGSLPPGAPEGGYAEIVRRGHDAGCEVIVDASGRVLRSALAAGADLVAPNLAEAEAALAIGGATRMTPSAPASAPFRAQAPGSEPVDDTGPDVPGRAAAAATGLRLLGAVWAVVTAGSAGAAVAGPGHREWLPASAVTVRNPIGAGDSFLAGVASARLAGRDWPTAIRRGLAAGSASVEQDAAGVLDPARVDALEAAQARRLGDGAAHTDPGRPSLSR